MYMSDNTQSMYFNMCDHNELTIWQDTSLMSFAEECSCFPCTAVEFPLTWSCSFSLQVNVLHSKKRCEVLETVSFVGLVTCVCVCVCVCVWEWVCKSLSFFLSLAGWLSVCSRKDMTLDSILSVLLMILHETFFQSWNFQSLIVCFKQKYWFHLPL